MGATRRIDRSRTDEERIEHFAEADGDGDRGIGLGIDVRPWLAGSVVSAVQVQVLDGRSPGSALEHGGIDSGPQDAGAEENEGNPE